LSVVGGILRISSSISGCAYRLASHDLQTSDNNGNNQAGAHTAGTSRAVVRCGATIQRVEHVERNNTPPRSRTRYRNFWPSHLPSNHYSSTKLSFRPATHHQSHHQSSPVTTLSPALSETNKFSSHLPPARRPGDSQPPTQKALPLRGLAGSGRSVPLRVATFPFSCTADPMVPDKVPES
jgi:hypothetical protein